MSSAFRSVASFLCDESQLTHINKSMQQAILDVSGTTRVAGQTQMLRCRVAKGLRDLGMKGFYFDF